jgi:hypothetical protein
VPVQQDPILAPGSSLITHHQDELPSRCGRARYYPSTRLHVSRKGQGGSILCESTTQDFEPQITNAGMLIKFFLRLVEEMMDRSHTGGFTWQEDRGHGVTTVVATRGWRDRVGERVGKNWK